MDKRGYKLQEFVAHSANVNCLKIGKKSHRNFITGGDDEKVNLWSIGKPTATTSLSGHTSPIESVAFDKTEVLVAAGASSGVIKLWDLEETKVVRTLNGHRSYCTALEFHPFGEFFASGSMDTNLKIWDIRKKGCIHTYKGHRRAVSTIRFSPDGRWVVSGGLDNVVKIWDLTAGKLLHEFKFHEGHIRSMDFHPLEFLLATGSSDRTVKFWDLETFELIGSTRPEATGVRSVTFHPDGRTLFCGLDSSLKVYSWEPVVCHDALDMGWSTLGDLCINDGKLLGCSYYQNSVAVWVADTTLIEPHGRSIVAKEKTRVQPKFDLQQDSTERVGSQRRSTISPDDDTKDIKNIYVDSVTPVASRKSPTVMNLQNPKEIDNLTTRKQVPATKIIGQANNDSEKDVINLQSPKEIDNLTTRKQNPVDKIIGQAINNSAKETTKLIINEQDNTTVSVKPSHRRRPSTTKLDIEQMSLTVESGLNNGSDTASVMNFQRRFLADNVAKDSSNEKTPISTSVTKEFQKPSSPGDKSIDSNKELKSVKYVNGVAIVHGKTRSLVERFEKREKLNTDESQSQTPDQPTQTLTNTDTQRVKPSFDAVPCATPELKTSQIPVKTPDLPTTQILTNTDTPATRVKPSFQAVPCVTPETKTSQISVKTPDEVASREPETITLNIPEKRANMGPTEVKLVQKPESETSQISFNTPDVVISEKSKNLTLDIPEKRAGTVSIEAKLSPLVQKPDSTPVIVVQRPRTAPSVLPEKGKASPVQRSVNSRRVITERNRSSSMLVTRRSNASPRTMPERTKISPVVVGPMGPRHDTPNRMTPERTKTSPVVVGPSRHDTPNRMTPEKAKSSPLLDDGPQTTGRGLTSKKDDDVAEDLMINHDVFVSSLRSRLTKLQVVRHFFVQKDMRGAINALRKLPDHAVQADVVSVLMEKMDSLTLDIFSELLPVLLDLLDSKTDRHINVSLELLVKLVAVFGPVVSSTISAPPTVGVDLHAEKRLESCNECHKQIQKINKCLPAIIRRGGLPARCGQELNIILQKL